MSINVSNPLKAPYLRVQRAFPEDSQALSVELSKAYVDIANNVNSRTIGVYAANSPTPNGNFWYLTTTRQQGQRQVYPFTAVGNIPHGINVANIGAFVVIYGTFTDGTNWYPLPYVDVVSVTNQVNVTVTATNIVITAGGGSPPSIVKGYVVLEWIASAN